MLGWFFETLLIASAMAVVALLVSRIRSIGPAARHVFWVVVLVKLLMPPLIAWPWAIPTLWTILNQVDGEPMQTTARWIDHDADESGVARVLADNQPSADFSREDLNESEVVSALDTSVESGQFRNDANGFERAAVSRIRSALADSSNWVGLLGGIWLVVSLAIAVGQLVRVIRFRNRLRGAVLAPRELRDESDRIAFRMGVTSPRILVVEDLATPLLWCLGRATLLLPAALVETLASERWPAILTHELAHLRRGDQWISRLDLLASLVWWWNPIYWLTRTRLDTEAELACDAWVVWALPKDRLDYAESLFELSSILSRVHTPAPALGIAGSGRFFERRLMMILHDETPIRPSRWGLLGAMLLLLFAAPSWSGSAIGVGSASAAAVSDAEFMTVPNLDPDNDDDEDDDDDDDKDAAKARAKFKADKKKSKVTAKASSGLKGNNKPGFEFKFDLKGLDADLEKLKAGAEELAKALPKDAKSKKEMEEFQARAEAFGKTVAKSLGDGSDFEKKFEELGKEIEKKFGDGSDFQVKIEAIGELIEKKFGDGSDFQKEMEAFGKKFEKSLGKGSNFEKKIEGIVKEAQDKSDSIQGEQRVTKEAEAVANKKRSLASIEVAEARRELAIAKAKVAAAERKAAEANDRSHSREKAGSDVANSASSVTVREKQAARIAQRMTELEGDILKLKKELETLRGQSKSK